MAVSLVVKENDEGKDDSTKVRCAWLLVGSHPACVCISACVQELRWRLEPAQWQTARDGYAVALDVLGVLDMKSAMLHKRHMLVLTENAVREGRKPLFSVLTTSCSGARVLAARPRAHYLVWQERNG